MSKIIPFPEYPGRFPIPAHLENLKSIVPDFIVVCDSVVITKDGVPVFLVDYEFKDLFSAPSYDDLNTVCESYTYKMYGQAFMVTDLMARYGFCTFKNAPEMRHTIISNLKNGIFILVDKTHYQ